MRGESGEILKSVEEAVRTAEESGCRLEISPPQEVNAYTGLSMKTLGMMEDARRRGVDVTCDVYPYSAGSTLISVVLPAWAKEGGVEKMLARLAVPADRERIKSEFLRDIPGWDNFIKAASYDKILVCSCATDHSMEGKTVQAIADERGIPAPDAILDIMLSERAEVTIVIDSQSPSDNRRIIAHELSMIGSDSLPSSFSGRLAYGKPIRGVSDFPRVLCVSCARRLPTLAKAYGNERLPGERFGVGPGMIKAACWGLRDLDPRDRRDRRLRNPGTRPGSIFIRLRRRRRERRVPRKTLGKRRWVEPRRKE
jgi:N-acyl-D-aspartate/D-glutamate deacylase